MILILNTLITLLFVIGLLILVSRYLTQSQEVTFSVARQYLTVLSTLIPEQTREVGKAITDVVNPPMTLPTKQQVLDKLLSEQDPEQDSEPFLPPWEVESPPVQSVPKNGAWQ